MSIFTSIRLWYNETMKKVYLIHGYGGEPNGGWRPWLMGKLAREEVWACALAMPMADEPKKDEWVKEMQRVIGTPNENIFLVGHSLGVPAILRYLESLPTDSVIGGVVLVSGPIHPLYTERHASIAHFMSEPFDFVHIQKVCKQFAVIHGDNDEVVTFDHAAELAQQLGCSAVSIPGGGHLNGSSGWYELPEALEALNKMMNK